MCGICGDLRFDGAIASTDAVGRMMERMAARGPEDAGIVAHGRVALGHRRLKIIDLSDHGQQPMSDPDLGLTLVFNGCIYNYRELRETLEGKGYRFFSNSDTEVILKAWHAWGEDSVARLNGMFAFAMLERDSGRLTLARDRLGIKPLYIAGRPDGLRFASSLPALLAAGEVDTGIDPVALHFYMSFHAVVPAPFTILAGIRKVPPGTLMRYEADGTHRSRQYWSLAFEQDSADLATSAEEWKERLGEALRLAVSRRMVADVPVGVLLSGGVDSSLIVGLLAEAGQQGLNTFSVGFEAAGGEKGDEFRYSDLIAQHFGTEHHQIFVPTDRVLETLPRTFQAMSEPMVSHDNIGFFVLAAEVSQHLKVVQSGQGADEVFGGYHWYPPLMDSNDPVSDYASVFFDRGHGEFLEAVHPDRQDEDFSRAYVAGHFGLPGADRAIDKALRLDTTVMLVDDPVKRVDNMTMAWGLEARVPFLDHELVELAGHIPAEHKIRDGGKWILKELARDVIPAAVIDRPKGYFPVPALKHLQGPYLDFVRDAVTSDRARERKLFNAEYVDRLLEEPSAHITPLQGSKLWQVGMLEMWLQEHGL
ncbi:N-acetylglutaminylglutamine amidotransferase [Oceanibacterium hippocampi]|uniref:asparagine synthase (glutamine-hydrolyzing) n=1 Tax=Oceanibacterium hippocampi TaxID=745714 RepID=A0A1Y5SQY3_9PROT|nr:N-acetylglutaminylglutamine amidotransferase [Oceanibacterium hippocampi]SLN45692.1 Asparagine synthetase [glutamine-hydrolyzing] 1 [Oceanibacterium hippocampi]